MEQEDFNIREHQLTSKERDFENALRPLSFEDFSGQDKVVENLRIFVKAARLRGEALDHVLLHGPPGLGKTTLSNIIANELGVGFKVTSGPVLDKPGDLAGVLTSLEPNDVLFIDEIHRLSPVVEEYLYSAMEELRADGHKVALAQFKYINPLPRNTAEVLRRYRKVVVAEQNLGQLAAWLRANVDGFVPEQYNEVKGQPFVVSELVKALASLAKK